MAEPMQTVTYNADIHGLVRRIDRVLQELFKSASANLLDWRDADRTRIDTYIGGLVAYKAWAVSMPELDVPETHPKAVELPVMPVIPPIENESVADACNQLVVMRTELVKSQSNRLPNGLTTHDAARFDSYVAKLQTYLVDYVDKTHPIDMPESSPAVEVTGHGK